MSTLALGATSAALATLPNPFLGAFTSAPSKPAGKRGKLVGARAAKGTGKPPTGARKPAKGGAPCR